MIVKISDKQAEYILNLMDFYIYELGPNFSHDEHVLMDEIRKKLEKPEKKTRARDFNFRG